MLRIMTSLSKTWLTDHLIDFEYKKYLLLDYVKNVKDCYGRSCLYPYFSDSIEHFRNLSAVKNNAMHIRQEGFKTMTGFDWEHFIIKYDSPSFDHDALEEIDRIIGFALPNFKVLVSNGKSLYDHVEQHLSISAVGIVPMRTKEGYLLLNEAENKHLAVYQYAICNIEDIFEQSRMLTLEYISDYTLSVTWNPEAVKHDLIRSRRQLPNPAVYAISCGLPVPFQETFLPVAKRCFMQQVARA